MSSRPRFLKITSRVLAPASRKALSMSHSQLVPGKTGSTAKGAPRVGAANVPRRRHVCSCIINEALRAGKTSFVAGEGSATVAPVEVWG